MRTKIEPTHHAIATILIDDIISEMVQYLMEDYGYSLEKSLEMVYQSHTVELLQIEEGELYVQSPAYVYDMLIKELHLYPVFDSNAVGKVAETTQGDCPLV